MANQGTRFVLSTSEDPRDDQTATVSPIFSEFFDATSTAVIRNSSGERDYYFYDYSNYDDRGLNFRGADKHNFTTDNDSSHLALSTSGLPNDYVEWQIATNLWLWVTPLMIIIGTSGNGLSFLTLRSCAFRKSSIAFTLSALAIVDTSVLYTTMLRQWILYLTNGYDVRTLLWSFGCKIHFFLTYYLCQLSSWTLVVVTAERTLCVSMPFVARTACTKTRIIGAWVLVALLLAVVNSHFLWTAVYLVDEKRFPGRNETEITHKCFIGYDHILFFYRVWYWIDFTLLSIIPFAFIIIGNCVITVCVVRAMEFRRQQQSPSIRSSNPHYGMTSSSTSSGSETCKPLTSSTAMLIGISIMFLVTTTPSAIFFLNVDHWIGDGSDSITIARIRLAFAVTNLLYYANNSLNFLLYCLTGSRFRRAFVEHFRPEHVQPRNRRPSRAVGTRTSNCAVPSGNIGLYTIPA